MEMSKESNKKNDVKKKNSAAKVEKNEKDNKKTKSKATKDIEKEVKEVEEVIEEFEEEEYDDYDDYEEYDEDLELDEEDDEEEVKIELVEDKKKKEKKEKIEKTEKLEKEDKKNKITEIEKKVKIKKKKEKKFNFDNVISFFENNHLVIYGFIGGVLLSTLVAFIIWPDRIAALKNGEEPIVKVGKKNYTADYLYEVMKDTYSVNSLLNEIDKDLLSEIYPEDDEMKEEVESNANYYFDTYEQYYGYTKEQFLQQNGFASLEDFHDYLKLDYRRNKYLDDYITKKIEDKEIDKYYKDNVFGDINTQHVLVEVSSSEDDGKLSDEDAKTLADEIIDKLNDGTSWEKIQKKYKD